MRLFIADPAVVAIGCVLLRIAALFELFDGFQIVATGALRGLGYALADDRAFAGILGCRRTGGIRVLLSRCAGAQSESGWA